MGYDALLPPDRVNLIPMWSAQSSEISIMRAWCFVIAATMVLPLLGSPVKAASEESLRGCNQRSNFELEIAACNRALAEGGLASRTVIFNRIGNAWYDRGEYDRALASYDEGIQADPQYGEIHSARGNVWYEKGDYDRALADYNEAIRLNPKDRNGFNGRANVWLSIGEYDRAFADLNETIRIAPHWGIPYSLRGRAWRLKGDLDRALADQNYAVNGPRGAHVTGIASFVLIERGDTYRYRGDFRHAIADYDQALRNVPGYVPALTGLGLTYERMGDLAKARLAFEHAVTSGTSQVVQTVSKSSLETARARLAAFDSGIVQPSIPISQLKATSATSIPTPTISVAAVPPAAVQTTIAKEGRRVALVIGNSAYMNVPKLVNPEKDATAIAASLRNIGFDSVTLLDNATREDLIQSLIAFGSEAEKADWAMVYYAGHGMEVGGVNYLVPINAKLAVDRDIQLEAVPLDQVLSAVVSSKKLKLVVLDACRDNPFSPRKTAAPEASAPTGGAVISSRSIGRGLAEVKASGATLVVFAAKNGQVALDGDGGNSPFAAAVLQRLPTPDVEINKLFRLVRDDVMEATAGRQEPYTYGSLPGNQEFYFVVKQ
ncbi:caspase family protein [Bradyrhizobium sp. S69]|uniref:caspase family protein n=1 Tax=Bradyrhizobium sp. S69 TaxID=1641856 RepID=UPI00131B1B5E|nr:caspase family protein [Bradyrhizobium sp. S69]